MHAGERSRTTVKPCTRGGDQVRIWTAIRCLCIGACLLAVLEVHHLEGAAFNYSGQFTSSTYARSIPPGLQMPTDCATPTSISGFGSAVRYQAQKIRVDTTGTYTIETTSAIILWHERPIGRLYIERRTDEMLGIDIALLPEYRQSGIGTAILRDLLAEAARDGKPFRIHVQKFNRAQRLYERLGFTTLDDDGVYLFMEWRPDAR